MSPLPDDIKLLANQIISICDRRIQDAQPNIADAAEIAADKLEIITTYQAIQAATRGLYTL